MLSLIRLPLRLSASKLTLRAGPTLSSPSAVTGLRFQSTEAAATPVAGAGVGVPEAPRVRKWIFCYRCRMEGHGASKCKQPIICRACGTEGHVFKNCPSPDPERVAAMGPNAPRKCFRCGVVGHTHTQCTQPIKCYGCGEEGHYLSDCPARPAKPAPVKHVAPASA